MTNAFSNQELDTKLFAIRFEEKKYFGALQVVRIIEDNKIIHTVNRKSIYFVRLVFQSSSQNKLYEDKVSVFLNFSNLEVSFTRWK